MFSTTLDWFRPSWTAATIAKWMCSLTCLLQIVRVASISFRGEMGFALPVSWERKRWPLSWICSSMRKPISTQRKKMDWTLSLKKWLLQWRRNLLQDLGRRISKRQPVRQFTRIRRASRRWYRMSSWILLSRGKNCFLFWNDWNIISSKRPQKQWSRHWVQRSFRSACRSSSAQNLRGTLSRTWHL